MAGGHDRPPRPYARPFATIREVENEAKENSRKPFENVTEQPPHVGQWIQNFQMEEALHMIYSVVKQKASAPFPYFSSS